MPAPSPMVIVPTRITDLSEQGVRMHVHHPIEPGTSVLIDLECELPQQYHMGYGMDSLVVDGPSRIHQLTVRGVVRWARRDGARSWEVGVALLPSEGTRQQLQMLATYVEQLRREAEPWIY